MAGTCCVVTAMWHWDDTYSAFVFRFLEEVLWGSWCSTHAVTVAGCRKMSTPEASPQAINHGQLPESAVFPAFPPPTPPVSHHPATQFPHFPSKFRISSNPNPICLEIAYQSMSLLIPLLMVCCAASVYAMPRFASPRAQWPLVDLSHAQQQGLPLQRRRGGGDHVSKPPPLKPLLSARYNIMQTSDLDEGKRKMMGPMSPSPVSMRRANQCPVAATAACFETRTCPRRAPMRSISARGRPMTPKKQDPPPRQGRGGGCLSKNHPPPPHSLSGGFSAANGTFLSALPRPHRIAKEMNT